MSLVSSAYAGHSARGARLFFVRTFTSVAVVFLAAGCVMTPRYAAVPREQATNTQLENLNQSLALMAGQALAEGDYEIGPEDLLEVTLFDIEDTQGEPRLIAARVSNTGFVTLPHVGRVSVDGMTAAILEKRLSEEFSRFIHRPQISVFVSEYRGYRVSVVGYVNRAGVLELKGKKTLLEALAMAGGLHIEAGRSVRVTREIVGQVQTVLIDLERLARGGDMSLNIDLLPGDVINVPRAGTFYVEGMVAHPGAYPLLQETTVTQALATAGGPDITLAKLSGIVLFRELKNGEREAHRVDLDGIRSGSTIDIAMVADDVLFVPVSGGKYFIDRLTGRLGLGYNLGN